MDTPFSNQSISATGTDYTRLRELLAQEKWQEADAETMALILRITDREAEGWIRVEDIQRISGEDLRMIDHLWVEHSHDRFGFSVQKRIWHTLSQNYTDFGDSVGWHREGSWLNYSDLNFDTESAMGHLPAIMFPAPISKRNKVVSFVVGKWRTALLSRDDL